MTWFDFKNTINNMWIGLTVGFILPILGFFASKPIKFPGGNYTSYWNLLISNTTYSTEILTLALIPNMLLFYFFFFQWRTDQAAKGLVFSTIIWVGLLFLLF